MKRSVVGVFIGILLVVTGLNPQSGMAVSFATPVDYGSLSFAYHISLGDLNRDGKTDMVVGSAGSSDLGILFGNGAGGFTQTSITAGLVPVRSAIADINQDGKPDIISANHVANTISVFLGDGAGSFAPKMDFASGDYGPYFIVAGDMNGDGKPDLAVAHFGEMSTTVSVMINATPAGSASVAFAAPSPLAIGGRQWAMALGDLDLDGKLDLAVASESNGLLIYFGDGTGGFSAPSTMSISALDVKITDVNTDGKPDLALAAGGSTAGVLLGNGTGGFAPLVPFDVGSQALCVDVGDLNGDGKLDLAVSCRDTGLSVLLGNGLGGFPARQDFTTGSSPWAVAIKDFNSDGKADIAVANELSHDLSVLLNTTMFPASGTLVSGAALDIGSRQWGLALGDLNLDGHQDLAVGSESSGLKVYFGDGAGGFSTPSILSVSALDIKIADVNADGKPDLVAANGGSQVGVLLGDGTGSFASIVQFAVGSQALGVDVGDLNGDGKLDLAVSCRDTGLSILVGDGLGGFPTRQDIATGSSSWSVAIADFNRDGRADLVVANELTPSVSVLLGDGTGGFLPQTDYDSVPFPYHVAVNDLDLDGDLDFVVGSAGSTSIAVFKGDGAGGFSRSFLTVGQTPARVATCDINRDGIPDIITANYTSGTISVLSGDGAGGFASSVDYPSADGGPYFIGVGDFNTDGKPDLAVAYFGGSATHASIYLNSPAQFAVTGTVLAGGTPVPNVVMTGLPGNPITNSSGVYQGLVSPGWSGTVTPTLAGYTFVPASRAYTAIASDQLGQDYAATLFVTHYTISGSVTLGTTGIAGVVMGGLPGNPITDSQGHYAASVESGFTATVTPALPGFTFEPPSRTYSGLGADATGESYAATFVGGADDVYEENDTQSTAAVIPLGTTRDLVLNDEEWFKFYVPAEDAGKDLKVRLWATAYPDGTTGSDAMVGKDLDFGVLNASGKLLNYALSGSADETTYICGAAEGWYTIADNYVGIPGTVYAISVELSDAFGLSYISGTVTAAGGGGIDGATVELYWEGMEWNQSRPLVCADSGGHYKIGWAAGSYTVRFNTQDFADDLAWTPDPNYLGALYHGGETVVVGSGATVTGVDGVLTPGGVISGRVTDADGHPLNQAIVYVYTADTFRAAYAYTDASGNYAIDHLRAANYAVRFRAPNGTPWANEWYVNRSSLVDCLPVPVAAGATTANIDAALEMGGFIHGHVTNAAGDPVQNVQVSALDLSGIALWTVGTNASGEYVIGNLPPGSFKILFNAFNAAGGFLASEYYPDKRLVGDAVPVAVTLGQTTDGIDAQLSGAGVVSGRITDAAGNGVGRVSVIAFDTASEFSSGASPDYAGYFTIRSLPPGTYRILARPAYANGDKAPKWYADAGAYASADPVVVASGGTVSGVNIVLDETGGSISGRVTDAVSAGIPGVTAIAQDATKAAVNYSSIPTDLNGNYTLPRVPAGQIKVLFNADAPYLGYASEYYNDKGDHAGADAVIVNTGETTPAVNAVLAARPALDITTASLPNAEFATPYSRSLALTGGRSFFYWIITSGALPEGLTLNARGEITGTPTVEGTFPFTVQASDSSAPQQIASKSLSITVGAYSGFGLTISGTVTAGGAPLPGVVLSGLPGSPVTNAAGHYATVVDPGWSGTVTPVLAGRFFDPVNRTYTTVTGNLTGQDYTAEAGYMISGRVTYNGASQSNVLLSGLPGETRTDTTGAYSAAVPAGWSGTVTPFVPGFTFAPADRTYSAMVANAASQDYTSSYSGGADDAYEDNDSFAAAATLPLGTTADLVLRDADWFRVYVPAGGPGRVLKVRLRATAFPDGTCFTDPNVGKDLDFGVLDASGKMLTFNLSGSADETAYVPDVAEGWYTISQMYVGFAGTVYSVTAEVSDAYLLGYVSGTIRDEGGQGIEGVCVELYEEPFDWNISRPLAATDALGHYKIAYAPGSYTVRFNITDFADTEDWTPEVNYIGKLYNYGAVIALSSASPLTDVDGVLSPGGTITGRVTDEAGDPLSQVQVRAFASDTAQGAFAFTDASGNYALRRLRPANYAINFFPPGATQLSREWFDDQHSLATATPVAVQASSTTSGVNAMLGTGGFISGHVTDMEGNPIQGVRVTALDASGLGQQSVTTNDSGDYAISRVTPGDLKVYFNASTSSAGNYASEYYPDKRFIADAGLVPVVLGLTTSGIDAQLAAAGTIAGRVTDGNGQAMPYAPVACFDTASDFVVSATADINGNYQVRNLPPGQYKVRLRASYGEWTLEWFDGKPTFNSGDAVTVVAGATASTVNASLAALSGSISGRVTDGLGSGIAGVTVQAQDVSRVAGIYSASTDADGYYTIGRVPPGSAKVFFNADASYLNYVSEYYSHKTGHGDADMVTVAAGETTSGINAVLATRPGLAVATASVPAGTVASAYSAQLAASGGRTFYHWTISSGSLPQGLSMNAKGEISGTPLAQGTFPFTVQVTDSTAPQQAATHEFSVTVAAYTGTGNLISGTVTAGGAPLAGVVLSGFPGSPATSAGGTYIAVVPSGWSGTVTPLRSGYAFDPAVRTYANASANMTGQDYAASPGFAISGTVSLNGTGQAGVLMAGLPGGPRTDASGAYAMTVPAGWSGTVTPTLPGFTFSPANRTYTNIAENFTTQDYTSSYAGGADDAYEENDSFAAAAVIAKGTTTDLILNDEDWFKVYIPAEDAGKDLRVRIVGTSYPDQTTRRDLDFAILDATGRMLSYSLSGSPDETAYICDIAEGWYYIAQTYIGLQGTVYSLTVDTNDNYGLAYVSGTVRDDGGQPIAGVCVELYGVPFNWDITRPLVATDSSGHYKIGYAPGDYQVEFNITDFNDTYDWTPEVNYIGEVYNGGDVLTLTGGATASGIDGQLTQGGAISGRITDASGNPLFMAVANAFFGNAASPAGVFTDANGNYVIDRLRAANYAVRMRAPGGSPLATEWYSDRMTFATALPVPVVAGQATTGIDAALGAAGSISGHVTDSGGNPIGGVQISVNDISGVALQTAMTDGSGNYFAGRLPAADLIVYFNATTANGVNFVSEYYPDKLFMAEAQAVTVQAGQTTSGIDAVLAGAGAISGRVTASGGTALVGVTVNAFSVGSGALSLGATTDALGDYTIRNLPPGDYKVRFRPNTGALVVEWWGDKTSFTTADPVSVVAGGTVTSVDGELAVTGGSIAGRVTDALGAPIAGLTVLAQDAAIPAVLSSAVTDQNGDYSITRLPSGQAKVLSNADAAFFNYVTEYYNDQGSHGAATPVTVVAGEATTGINAMLAARPALTITTASLPSGQLAVAYSATLAGTGGRTFYHWSIDSGALPDGLTMNGRGEIGGTPTLAGTYNFTVKLTDSTSPQQQTTRQLSITIGPFVGVGYTISGKILFGGQPLAGVIMNGLPGGPTTNASGGYVGVVTDGWWGTVTPTLQGYWFTPANRGYSNVTASQENQDFTATDVIPSSITVIAPNGGESWAAGSNHNVTWTQTGLTGPVIVDLYKGGVYQKTLGTPDAALGTFSWAISASETPGIDYRIRIRQASISDESNADFAILAAVVRKDDLVGTWDGQGVYYKNSDTGSWIQMASPASMVTCGDLDNDGTDDLIGIWPGQGGVWVKYSSTGGWAYVASTAVHITSGDMNGDGRAELLGTWNGQGVFYRNSVSGAWVLMASPASMITSGDLDNDGTDDLIGIWPGQGGVWVKYSLTGNWAYIASTAQWIAAGDMNGDGRDELLGTWDGQGVYYRNSETGAWVLMASPATMITAGDLDGDGTDDLIGLWPAQGGIWVKHSTTGAWELLSSTAQYISAGKMRPMSGSSASVMELPLPMGGTELGPEGAALKTDESSKGPGGWRFVYFTEPKLMPKEAPSAKLKRVPGPGNARFRHQTQSNLTPRVKTDRDGAKDSATPIRSF